MDVKFSLRWWHILGALAVVAGIATAVLVPPILAERKKDAEFSEVSQGMVRQFPDAVLREAVKIQKVFLVSWSGSDTSHLGLYLDGFILEISPPSVTKE